MKNHYFTLRIGMNSSPEALKSAYRRQAMKHHPDHGAQEPSAFVELQEAYALLADSKKRSEYDAQLREFLRRRNLHLCPHCGGANQIPYIPPGQTPVCGACKTPLPVTEEIRRIGQRSVLIETAAQAVEQVGGDVIGLARDALRHGIRRLRQSWFKAEPFV